MSGQAIVLDVPTAKTDPDGCVAHRQKAIWITWEHHRRTRELSRALGMELFELTCRLPRILRYVALLARTTVCVARHRPSILAFQCPSLVLGLWAGILKQIFRFTLVADLHNEAVCPWFLSPPPYGPGPAAVAAPERPAVCHWFVSSRLYEMLFRLVRRAADVCLVTNANLKQIVDRAGGRAFVLPDKVPDLALSGAVVPARSRRQAVFICSYAVDEPYLEVIEAARALDSLVTIHITGDYRGVKHLLPASPVHLTGFLPEAEYVELLSAADVLTSIEGCLVCGAYEAVALGKPLVTSDTMTLRNYFRMGTVYTKHDRQSLTAAIAYALAHKDRLAAEMDTLRLELARDWTRQKDALLRILQLGEATPV